MSVRSKNKTAVSAREVRRDYSNRKTDIITDPFPEYFSP